MRKEMLVQRLLKSRVLGKHGKLILLQFHRPWLVYTRFKLSGIEYQMTLGTQASVSIIMHFDFGPYHYRI